MKATHKRWHNIFKTREERWCEKYDGLVQQMDEVEETLEQVSQFGERKQEKIQHQEGVVGADLRAGWRKCCFRL